MKTLETELRWLCILLSTLGLACADKDGSRDPGVVGIESAGDSDTDSGASSSDPSDDPIEDMAADAEDSADSASPLMDMGPPPDTGPPLPEFPPMPLEPCENGDCWSRLTFSAYCGSTTVDESYSSGNFNVHEFELSVWDGRRVELSMLRLDGVLFPALVILDEMGETVYDGEIGAWNEELTINPIATGEDGEEAVVEILPHADRTLYVYLTSWDVIESDFVAPIPTEVAYTFEVYNDCAPETGTELPPNFDPEDVLDGDYILPESEPPGLYERKMDACSRGNRRAIEVIYTVARRWAELRPDITPMQVRDINENVELCGVDHQTHDDGTHFDIIVGCASDTVCLDVVPVLDLARLYIDTGEVCGIINNNADAQEVINPYFAMNHGYDPWNGGFMRSVDGHEFHFHVRVKKPDESCN